MAEIIRTENLRYAYPVEVRLEETWFPTRIALLKLLVMEPVLRRYISKDSAM